MAILRDNLLRGARARHRGRAVAVLAAALALLCATPALALSRPAAGSSGGEEVVTWGRNQYGQLGIGSTTSGALPGSTVPVRVLLPSGTVVTAVSGGYGHTAALTSTGRVLAWGQNDVGQLGDGSEADSTVPVSVDLPTGTTITDIASGDDHVLALTSTGRVLAWGYNDWGQLGAGSIGAASDVPVEVHLPAGTTVTEIATGAGHSLALTSTGQVLAWGDNDFGQLGDGTRTNRDEPVEAALPAGTVVTRIAGGDDHSLALTSTGQVLAWGYNGSGQLGDGTTTTRTTPVEVHLPAGTEVTGIAAGHGFQSFAMTSASTLLAWGDNSYGQLGDGTVTRRTEPVQVLLPAGALVTQVASGDDHTVALTSTGQVLAWGYNRYGQVGDGSTTNRSAPVEVTIPESTRAARSASLPAVGIGTGSYHSMAIVEASAESATDLSAQPSSGHTGDAITFTATVACTAGAPTGTVTFLDGTGRELGTAPVGADGRATLVLTDLPQGQHTVTAHYAGDTTCPPSVSSPVTVTITAESRPTPSHVAPAPTYRPGPSGALARSGVGSIPAVLRIATVALALGAATLLLIRRRRPDAPRRN
jgi:alpha-tubulin suppressor-like RCC1 family protein